jgi:hypothetical protein
MPTKEQRRTACVREAYELARSGRHRGYSTIEVAWATKYPEAREWLDRISLRDDLRQMCELARRKHGDAKGPQGQKRPADVVGNAVRVMRIATGEAGEEYDTADQGKDPAAAALGKKGGKARAEKMTAEQRREMARRAAVKRWSQK